VSTQTTHYGLVKDDETDFYDVIKVNSNLNKIDETMYGKLDKPVLSFKDLLIDTLPPKIIGSYTPSTAGNFEIKLYARIISNLNLTIAVTYTDATGVQTKYIKPVRYGLSFDLSSGVNTYDPGSYIMVPILINAVALSNITITATANTANKCYISGTVLEV
jgi:hypothetical protein